MALNHLANTKREPEQSQAFDQEVVEAFASLFKGREDKYGWLRDETTSNYIVLPNQSNPEPAPVTLDLYRNHLLGKRWLGIFPLVNDRCRFAAIDQDEENFKKALAFRDALSEWFGLKAYIAKTKMKGYRVILFFTEPIIAKDVIAVLDEVVGNPQTKIEVFPKQPIGTFENPGNFFNLPSFGDRCSFLTGDNQPVPLQYALDHIKYNTEEHLRRALEKIQKAAPPLTRGKQPKHAPCIAKILWGVDEEQRDAAALAIARYYLAWYNPEEVLGLLKVWDGKNRPPLNDEGLLKNKVGVAEYSQATDHGFTCSIITDDLRLSAFCVGEKKCEWLKKLKEKEPRTKEMPERSDEFNALAIEKLLETCSFMRHCQDDARTLAEPDWFSECDILSFFGEPGRQKAHELSQPYEKYTREKTNKKLEYAKKAKDKDIGPHTCAHIEKNLGFPCPADCRAKEWNLKSPVVLASRLARTAGLPLIFVTDRFLKEKTADTIAAVEQANKPPQIFERSGSIVRIAHDEFGAPYIETLTESACRGFLERAACYVRLSDKGKMVPLPAPPLDIVRDYMSLPNRNLPALLNVSEIPVLRSDGSIVTEPGYDEASRLYYEPEVGLNMPIVPDNPSKEELAAAVAFIQEPILDFPFDSEASRTNALAVVITPVCRPMITGLVPLCLLDKPQPGTGAGLLSDVIAVIATGRQSVMMAPPRTDEECEKRLASILLHGQAIITIDNVEGYLYFSSLAMLLTTTTFQTRILGQSKEVRLPNRSTYIVTGNNIKLGGDMARRCYLSRMDAREARPWMRDPKSFKYQDLINWVKKNRSGLLAAILTMTRAWVAAGKPVPEGLPPLGGFEDWTNIIGGVLTYAGFTSFLGNLAFMYQEADVGTPQWEGFLTAWQETFGEDAITTDQVVKSINAHDSLEGALPDTIDRDPKKINRSLGAALSKRNGVRYPNGLMVTKSEKPVHHAVAWQVINYRENPEGGVKRGVSTQNLFSYKSDTKGELGELASQARTLCPKLEEKGIYEYGVDHNSPNSLQSQKRGVSAENIPEDHDLAPVYPTRPCPTCGCGDYWLTDDNRWLCARCHPKPKEIDMEV